MSFNIEQVVDYLGIEKLKQTGGDSIPICCPYCGDRRGKNTICIRKDGKEKNVFQCFACGKHGNMLDLYLDQKAGYQGTDRYKKAYSDLRRILEVERQMPRAAKQQERSVCKASEEILDHTYRQMLGLLKLQGQDLADLKRRMLTDAEIKAGWFRSAPYDTRGICKQLQRLGCQLEGVPGFYRNRTGNWQLNVWPDGYFCPVMQERKIVGMQIRLRNPKKQKYIWLSSAGRMDGCSSGSPFCFYGHPDTDAVIITEGILKAYVTYCLLVDTGVSVLGVPGVTATGQVTELLKKHHHKVAYEAFDMDKYMQVSCMQDYDEKKCVSCMQLDGKEAYEAQDGSCRYKERKRQMLREAQYNLYQRIMQAGVGCRSYHWDLDPASGLWLGTYKGIDDYCSLRRKGGMNDAGARNPGRSGAGAM